MPVTPKRIYACANPACPNGAYFPTDGPLQQDHTNRIWSSHSPFFLKRKDGTYTDACGCPIRVYDTQLWEKKVERARLEPPDPGQTVQRYMTVFAGGNLPWKRVPMPVNSSLASHGPPRKHLVLMIFVVTSWCKPKRNIQTIGVVGGQIHLSNYNYLCHVATWNYVGMKDCGRRDCRRLQT